jgi:Rrf2 family transcriptional regulator, iron-sulfur cluster assembly transcription factor
MILELLMSHFSKLTQTALAAMCQLGEAYGTHRLNAFAIADASHLPRPIVAKVLTYLARAGLVSGTRGPGGGFQLTRAPEQIRLGDIVNVFEKCSSLDERKCPLGVSRCGLKGQCPLRIHYVLFQSQLNRLLQDNSLLSFIDRA